MKEEATGGSTRVDGVREADEVDALLLEERHEVYELLHASTEPVELPDDERVAFSEDIERTVESRAIRGRPGPRVIEDPLASRACQRLVLNVETLV